MLLSLIVASLLVMGSPGPSTISVTAVGAAFGLRRSIAYLSGLVAGTMAVLLSLQRARICDTCSVREGFSKSVV